MNPRVTISTKIRMEIAQNRNVCEESRGSKPTWKEPCHTTKSTQTTSTKMASPYTRRFFIGWALFFDYILVDCAKAESASTLARAAPLSIDQAANSIPAAKDSALPDTTRAAPAFTST